MGQRNGILYALWVRGRSRQDLSAGGGKPVSCHGHKGNETATSFPLALSDSRISFFSAGGRAASGNRGTPDALPLQIEARTAVPVSIASKHNRVGGGLEEVAFTLTCDGETTAELQATVTLVQDQSWLAVTLPTPWPLRWTTPRRR